MTLIDLTLAVHEQLDAAGLPHAFGGALALAYVAEPRGTVDIDVNVFVSDDDVNRVLVSLRPLGLEPESPVEGRLPAAGLRLRQPDAPFPVDLFLSLDDSYDEIASRIVLQPFGPGGDMLPFLSAEDLVVFKLSFGRAKDWVDLAAIASALGAALDLAYIERQLLALRGPQMHPRLARLAVLARERG